MLRLASCGRGLVVTAVENVREGFLHLEEAAAAMAHGE